mgnify:CR=1 FL=1
MSSFSEQAGFSAFSDVSLPDVRPQENSDSDISSLFTSESEGEESSSDDDLEWSDQLHDVKILLFIEPVGPKHNLSEDAQVLEYFYLLFEEDFFDTMATETNRYAEQKQRDKPDSYWRPTSVPVTFSLFLVWFVYFIIKNKLFNNQTIK